MAEQMQGGQAPIDAVKTQMLGEPVFQFILPLGAVNRLEHAGLM